MSKQNSTNPEESKKLNWFYRIFCWCSGANLRILNGLESEYNKYFGAGVLILLVGTIAMFSGGYAISTIFRDSSYIPFIIGPIWGIFIFSLDRYFVSSMIKRGNRWQDIRLAIPRLFLAVFLGIVVSRPIELAVFQPEIEDQLRAERNTRVDQIDSLYTASIAEEEAARSAGISSQNYDSRINTEEQTVQDLQTQVDEGQRTVDSLFQEFRCECLGACGTGKKGYGPVCERQEGNWKLAEKQHLTNLSRWQTLINQSNNRIDELKNERDSVNKVFVLAQGDRINDLEAKRDSLKKVEGVMFSTSLLNRSKALSAITSRKNDGGANLMTKFIMILFVLLEVTPVLVKLLIPRGPYDDAYVTAEEQASRENMIKKRLVREEYKLNSLLINRMALSQRNIIRSKLEQWEQDQIVEEEEVENEEGAIGQEKEIRNMIREEMERMFEDLMNRQSDNGSSHTHHQNGQAYQAPRQNGRLWGRILNVFKR